MKCRNGFVSNSSSSSFIVVGSSGLNASIDEEYLVIGEEGKTEFGWGPDVLRDIHSRINLAAMIAKDYSGDLHQERWDQLIKIIKSNSKVKFIDYIIGDVHSCEVESDKVWGYVDHQSVSELSQIFFDEEHLRRFIFDSASEIVLDNDNH